MRKDLCSSSNQFWATENRLLFSTHEAQHRSHLNYPCLCSAHCVCCSDIRGSLFTCPPSVRVSRLFLLQRSYEFFPTRFYSHSLLGFKSFHTLQNCKRRNYGVVTRPSSVILKKHRNEHKLDSPVRHRARKNRNRLFLTYRCLICSESGLLYWNTLATLEQMFSVFPTFHMCFGSSALQSIRLFHA